MPELAEAEIHRRNLNSWTVGRTLQALEIFDQEHISGDAGSVEGRRILRWSRRAKYLIGHFEGGQGLLIHLGMSGNLFRCGAEVPPYTRFLFRITSDTEPMGVALVDRRRLGRLWLVSGHEILQHPRLVGLGPEPTSPDFHAGFLCQRLGKRKAALHSRLLEQSVGAGVGNIAIIEACHRAGIHPHTACEQLNMEMWWSLVFALRNHFDMLLSHPVGEQLCR